MTTNSREFAIAITDYKCLGCGHRWPHSFFWSRLGAGYQCTDDLTIKRSEVVACLHNTCTVPLCYRCVPFTEMKGWPNVEGSTLESFDLKETPRAAQARPSKARTTRAKPLDDSALEGLLDNLTSKEG